MKYLIALASVFLLSVTSAKAEIVRFATTDGVVITADFQSPQANPSTIIVLYHMAGSSRGEYIRTAQRLNALGYGTLAVDQRSGGQFDGVRNETVAALGRNADYLDAIPDLLTASAWARQQPGVRQVGVLGSSYSAGLVLALAGQYPTFADAVMSFSPGEYYGSPNYVTQRIGGIRVPVFLTAARNETGDWQPFVPRINSPVVGFEPAGAGRHGASTLDSRDGAEYWAALEAFLAQHFPTQ